MTAATDHDLSALGFRTGNHGAAADADLFALIDELRQCEKRREDLLDRLSIEENDRDRIETAVKTACDAARAIYSRIAAIKPTTLAGVLRQLELADSGWVAPSTVTIAIAGLREIAVRPPPLKVGRLPAVPTASRAPIRQPEPAGSGFLHGPAAATPVGDAL
jgi:hypothetical protein